MDHRPLLNKNLNSESFKNYYYLKEELVDFCRKHNLQTTGNKAELNHRIAHYLDTGEMLATNKKRVKANTINAITPNAIIEENFVCSEKHRAFFKEQIGKSFSFNVSFQKWLKANFGKTYREAVNAYQQILKARKSNKTTIDEQFEYNTYIRAFFADNKGKTLEDAIKCWQYKKNLSGHHRYQSTDLIVLEKTP
jgi:hypothetical protein